MYWPNRRWSIEHGDALKVLSSLPSDVQAGAIITDPPYTSVGSASQATSKAYFAGAQSAPDYDGETRDARSFAFWLTLILIEARRVTKPGGIICVFIDWRGDSVVQDVIQAAGWTYRGKATWNKGRGTRPRRGGFRSQCEFIVWGSNGPMGDGSGVCLDGCFDISRRTEEKEWHQMAKPVELCEQLVQVARLGELIIDPFAGGASIGVAALRQGRRYFGVESSKTCHALAVKRMKEAA
jgi:site-specific DNA-methyltransferase (adenine-specific)